MVERLVRSTSDVKFIGDATTSSDHRDSVRIACQDFAPLAQKGQRDRDNSPLHVCHASAQDRLCINLSNSIQAIPLDRGPRWNCRTYRTSDYSKDTNRAPSAMPYPRAGLFRISRMVYSFENIYTTWLSRMSMTALLSYQHTLGIYNSDSNKVGTVEINFHIRCLFLALCLLSTSINLVSRQLALVLTPLDFASSQNFPSSCFSY